MNKPAQPKKTFPSIVLRLSRGRKLTLSWRPRKRVSGLLVKLLAAWLPIAATHAYAVDVNALPGGGQVTAGQATISQSGSTLNINQASQRASLNWQNFNIGSGATVNFIQPNGQSVALNRVLGNSGSEIYGNLNATGMVFLLNPNGVLFARGSQVNVGGIVAGTMGLSDSDFMAGNYVFSEPGTGSIVNQGLIAADGSVVLMGNTVANTGSLIATTASLVSGDSVALDITPDGLIRARVDDPAMRASIENSGSIEAAQVTLTAGQAGSTLDRVVNNSGVIRATGLAMVDGEIVLEAATVSNTGSLKAGNADGSGGTIMVMGDMAGGTVNVGGSLDASASNGAGGFIETSAATVNVSNTARVTTLGTDGSGLWLIDPHDFTIAATGGNMTGADVEFALSNGNFAIQSSSGSLGGSGDININDDFAWSSHNLILTAARDININAVMTASGTSTLTMNTATGNVGDNAVSTGTVRVGLNDSGFTGRVDFGARSGTGFLTINTYGYTVINSLGAQGSNTGADLQGMSTTGYYALGSNINASATSGWNSGEGFEPIAEGSVFNGTFDGLGHTIDNLALNRYYDSNGLFSSLSGTLRNIGMVNPSITSRAQAGALVGYVEASANIVNSYATGFSVTGSRSMGGLVGYADGGKISGSFASQGAVHATANSRSGFGGLVGVSDANIDGSHVQNVTIDPNGQSGLSDLGGLVGSNEGYISNSYALNPTVSGELHVGGLVGRNWVGYVVNSYALDAAVSGGSVVGGLVGNNAGSISYSYISGGSVNAGNGVVGGLVGVNSDGVSYSYARNAAVSGAGDVVGGLIGQNLLGVIHSYALNMTVAGSGMVGGLVGDNNSSSIFAYNYVSGGSISGESGVGGLVGRNFASSIEDSHVDGANVHANNSEAGGLVGRNERSSSQIIRSFVDGGEVSGTRTVGGLVGYNEGSIVNTYVTGGHVTGTRTVGGLVGANHGGGSITTSYAASGAVRGGSNNFGGLVGDNGGTVTNSLWDIDTTRRTIGIGHGTTSGATGFHSDDAYSSGIYTGFNFSSNWFMVDGSTRPFLQSEWSNTITNAHQLQLMSMNLTASYTLAADIDLAPALNTTASMWSSAGFSPVGNGSLFSGSLNGQGHDISNLFIDSPATDKVGLFGALSGSVSNVGLLNPVVRGDNSVGALAGSIEAGGAVSGSYVRDLYVSGNSNVGGLVGWNLNGSVSTSYASGGNVSASVGAGGLVGWNDGNGGISSSYASVNVSGGAGVGGLVAWNNGIINNSYVSGGSVSGNNSVGGLAGYNPGTISTSYAASGPVTGNTKVGGFVGDNSGTIITGIWDQDATGQGTGIGAGTTTGVTGIITNDAFTGATYSGFNFTTDWFMVEGSTRPFLRSEYSTTITNAHQLQLMAMDLSASYTLANDIDLGPALGSVGGMWSSAGFSPVGDGFNPFTGALDGQGHVISNLYIYRPYQASVALIGELHNGSVSDVGLRNFSVVGGSTVVSGLVGKNYSSISNSWATNGSVSGSGLAVGGLVGYSVGSINSGAVRNVSVQSSGSKVGGLVGVNTTDGIRQGSISNSFVVDSDVSGYSTVGGLVGKNESLIGSSFVSGGSINGSDHGNYVGGLVGYSLGYVSESHSTGNSVSGNDFVGGLVGFSGTPYAYVSETYVSGGSVTGHMAVGGLVGYNNHALNESYVEGVAVRGNTVIGGLVGTNSAGVITNAYVTGGSVSGISQVGGLAGANSATGSISNSYTASGPVSGTVKVGGLVGLNDGTVSYSLWDTGSTGMNASSGFGAGSTGSTVVTNSMYASGAYDAATYSIFTNFANDWVMIDGYTRPFLKSEYSTTITNAHQLQLMNLDLTEDYTLANDIDLGPALSGLGSMWHNGSFSPVGMNDLGVVTAFSGSLDGEGHSISNLRIHLSGQDRVGLIGMIGAGAQVSNLGLVGASVNANIYAGALAGQNYGTIENSYVTGVSVEGNTSVGALIGFNYGSISNSWASGGVVAGTNTIGGLTGKNTSSGEIAGSRVEGISVRGGSSVGGLVGFNEGDISASFASHGVVKSTYNTGGLVGVNRTTGTISDSGSDSMEVRSHWTAGGLAGFNSGDVSHSYVTGGEVHAETNAGGLVGVNKALIHGSYASDGNVSGDESVGGLVGANDSTAYIDNSYAEAMDVSGKVDVGGLVANNSGHITYTYVTGGSVSGEINVGGLVGYNSHDIGSSYAAGGVVKGFLDTGGLVGKNNGGTITASLWDMDTTRQTRGIGNNAATGIGNIPANTGVTGIHTAQAFSQATYTAAGLTFDQGDAWFMVEGNTRPFLESEWSSSITNAHQLQLMSKDLGADYTLARDIDLGMALNPKDGAGMWTNAGFSPVGDGTKAFTGSLDGQGYMIRELFINRPAQTAVGLFGVIGADGMVQDLDLADATVRGKDQVGVLAGRNAGLLEDIGVGRSMVGGEITVGALVGQNDGIIAGAFGMANEIVGGSALGGLAGWNSGSIVASYAMGGLVTGANSVGGLVGASSGSIQTSYVDGGMISGYSAVGGLVGKNEADGSIANTYRVGGGVRGHDAGGLVGNNAGSISHSYAASFVSGSGGSFGGLVANNSGSVSSSLWDSVTTGQNNGIGNDNTPIGVSSIQSTSSAGAGYAFSQATYQTAGFTFGAGGDWFMLEGDTRPFLQSEWSTTIINPHQLQLMSMNLGASYVLDSDIDLGDTAGGMGMWTSAGFSPITGNTGSYTNGFSGSFDGQGNVIRNLKINRPDWWGIGLFSANNGSISNVGLVQADISGGRWMGGLVGVNYQGEISNAYVRDSQVHLSAGLNSSTVGGLVGFNNRGSITRSYVTGGSVSGNDLVGGLVGYSYLGSITHSYMSDGQVSGFFAVGGLAGRIDSVLRDSYVLNSDVSGGGSLGGLAGFAWGATIANTYVSGGQVVGNVGNQQFIGGLVGGAWESQISDSVVTGTDVAGIAYVGGLVGKNGQYSTGEMGLPSSSIRNSYVTGGSVTAQSNVGGLVGANDDTGVITNSIASGGTVSNVTNSGGLIGLNSGNVANLYWDINTTGQTYGIGNETSNGAVTGYNTTNAFTRANYAGLNFVTDWFMVEGSTRPFLQSEWSSTITNAHQLQLMSMNLNASYTLANDIDLYPALNGTGSMWSSAGFSPVGESDSMLFTGSFDGRGHVISNLTINRQTQNNVGLFGVTDGHISNVGLKQVGIHGANNVGALAGVSGWDNAGSISNSWVIGGVVIGNASVGGLVGVNSILNGNNAPVITGSHASRLFVTGSSGVGGLAGDNNGAISDSHVSDVNLNLGGQGSLGSMVGGLVGLHGSGSISGSYVSNSTVYGNTTVGGLVGVVAAGFSPVINNSYVSGGSVKAQNYVGGFAGVSYGDLTAVRVEGVAVTSLATADGAYVGGLVGQNPGNISNSVVVSSSVMGLSNAVGGLVGANESTGNISGSHVEGVIVVGGADSVGGLAGYNLGGSISTSYAANGRVDGLYDVGGLVGVNTGNATIDNSYAEGMRVSGKSSHVGGLVGVNAGSVTLTYVSGGSVSGTDSVGGLVGKNVDGGTISNSYAASGAVSGDNYVGGLVGRNEDNANGVAGNLWDMDTTQASDGIGYDLVPDGASNLGATGIQTADAFIRSTYSGFNFSTEGDWFMVEGATRPFLQSEWRADITNAHQLQLMAMNLSAEYTLANDIDLAPALSMTGSMWSTGGFSPVGNLSGQFSGSFDGQNHVIENLYINRPHQGQVGLFGATGSSAGFHATIGNIGLVDAVVIGQSSGVGGLVGLSGSGSRIYNSYSSNGSVFAADPTWGNIGGLVGINNGEIAYSGIKGGSVTGPLVSGGLVGYNTGEIRDSHVIDSFVKASGYTAGGLVGQNSGTISRSYVSGGTILGEADVGGLVGVTGGDGSGIYDSVAVNNRVTGLTKVGGLVGMQGDTGKVTRSYAINNDVAGYTSAGGLVGYNQTGSTVSQSYVSGGSVRGVYDVGGFVGRNLGDVAFAYVIDTSVTGTTYGTGEVGGFVGSNYGSINNTWAAPGAVSGLTQQIDQAGVQRYLGGFVGSYAGYNEGSITQSVVDGTNSGQGWAVSGQLYGSTSEVAEIDASVAYTEGTYTATGAFGSGSFTPGTGGWFMVDGSTRPFLQSEYSTTILNAHQLQLMAMDLGGNYTLGRDIDLGETGQAGGMWTTTGFSPVGSTVAEAFTGWLDGQGHLAGNLFIDRALQDQVGLFGVNLGRIANLSLANATVTGDSAVGVVAGLNLAGIFNANARVLNNPEWFGGISSVTGAADAGGLVGVNQGLISHSYTRGVDVTSTGTGGAGGLVGLNETGGHIEVSHASAGAVTGGEYTGGLVGSNVNASVSESYAEEQDVSGTGGAGGLVGNNAGMIYNTYVTGGSVDGTGSAGGLVANNLGSIRTSYAAGGTVTSEGYQGGLTGNNSGVVSNSLWDKDTTGHISGIGNNTGNTFNLNGIRSSTGSIDAFTQATYQAAGFDFTNTWVMLDGTRPFLQSEWSTDIANAHQLQLMAMNLNADYRLVSDIDAGTTGAGSDGMWNSAGFVSVGRDVYGNPKAAFNGSLDGRDHTISGLNIDDTTTAEGGVGLFGSVGAGGKVANLTLEDATVAGLQGVAVVAGYNYGTIERVRVIDSVVVMNDGGEYSFGGLVGGNGGRISNSYVSGGSVSGMQSVGRLVGNNWGSVVNSYVSGGSVSGSSYVGGLAGWNDGIIRSTYVTGGSVSGNLSGVGGLVGKNLGSVSSSHVSGGSVSGNNSSVGGLVGWNIGMIQTSFVSGGSVTGNGGVGGLAGRNDSGSRIEESYVSGVAVDGDHDLGGFVGKNSGIVKYAYVVDSSVSRPSSSTGYAGGFVGYNEGSIDNTYVAGTPVAVSDTYGLTGAFGGWNSGSIDHSLADSSDLTWRPLLGGINANSVTITLPNAPGQLTEIGSNLDALTPGKDAYTQQAYLDAGLNFGTGSWFMVEGETRPFLSSEFSTTITNAHQLQLMAMNLDASYKLVNDINLTSALNAGGMWGAGGFSPVSEGDAPGDGSFDHVNAFNGVFNGGWYSISHLGIERPADNDAGLFGSISSTGVVMNVGLSQANVSAFGQVGALAGTNNGTILNAWVTDSVVSGNTTIADQNSSVGGLVGGNGGTIANSYVSGGTVNGAESVGGLVGYMWGGRIANSFVGGGSVEGTQNLGGLVGRIWDGSISNSFYNIDALTVNDHNIAATKINDATGQVTRGGLYAQQFGDWLEGGLRPLAIESYLSRPLSVSESSAFYDRNHFQIRGENDLKNVLAFAESGYDFALTANLNLTSLAGFMIPVFDGSFGSTYYDGWDNLSESGYSEVTTGRVISNLNINQAYNDNIGFVGKLVSGSSISDIGLSNVTVSGGSLVGGLAGEVRSGASVSGSFVTGTVSSAYRSGGLVGWNSGTLDDSYFNGSVSASQTGADVGGIAGYNTGTISNTYVGSGSVTGEFAGGLVGINGGGGTVSNSFLKQGVITADALCWNGDCGTGSSGNLALASLTGFSTYDTAGWDIADSGGSTAMWRIYDGLSAPLLRAFLTPLTITVASDNGAPTPVAYSRVYDGSTDKADGQELESFTDTLNAVFGEETAVFTADSKNAGARKVSVSGLYSNQLGYDITTVDGDLTITKLALTGSISGGGSTYGSALSAGTVGFTNVVGEDDVTGGTVSVSIANIPANKSTSGNFKAGTYTGAQSVGTTLGGADKDNYTFAGATANYTISKLALNGSIAAGSSTYGSALSAGAVTFTNKQGSDVLTAPTVAVDTTGNTSPGGYLNAGSYTGIQSVTALAGTDEANYSIGTYTGGNYTVNRATATLAAAKTYDGTTGFSAGQITVTGVNGESLALSGSGPATASSSHVADNATNYLTGSGGMTLANGTGGTIGLATNYNLPSLTARSANNTASVTAKALTATATISGTLTKTYDGTVDILDGSTAVAGLSSLNWVGGISGDNFNLNLSLAYSSANVAGAKTIGVSGTPTFSIGSSGSGSLASDYSFTAPSITPVSASITPASLTIIANSDNRTYSGTPYSGGNGLTYVGFVPNEDATVLAGAVNYAGSSQGAVDAGTYVIDISSGSTFTNSNYNIAYMDGTLTITGAAATNEAEEVVTQLIQETTDEPPDEEDNQGGDGTGNPVTGGQNTAGLKTQSEGENPINTEQPKGTSLQCSTN